MAQYCPSDKDAIRQVELVLNKQLQYDSRIKNILNRIDEGKGILLRSGKRLTLSNGGMFSRKRVELSKDNITLNYKSEILNLLTFQTPIFI